MHDLRLREEGMYGGYAHVETTPRNWPYLALDFPRYGEQRMIYRTDHDIIPYRIGY